MECLLFALAVAVVFFTVAAVRTFRLERRFAQLEEQLRVLQRELRMIASGRSSEHVAERPAEAAGEKTAGPGVADQPPLPASSATPQVEPAPAAAREAAKSETHEPPEPAISRAPEAAQPHTVRLAAARAAAWRERLEISAGEAKGGAGERVATARREDAAGETDGLEFHVTTRIAIWLGAIALFLAGAFLVKYTFDAGLLSPAVRIVLGAVFGLALIGAGEWLRLRTSRIAEGLTAAGIAVLYAVTLAALNLYHFIGPAAGFALLAVITAAAIGLSLRQGPFVAGLGFIGGFITPGLIGTQDPRPGPLFVYLFMLQAALAAVARRRAWWPLSWLAFGGGVLWVLIWLLTNYEPLDSAWLAGFLLASLALVLVAGPEPTGAGQPGVRELSIAASLIALAVLGAVVHSSGFALTDWLFVGLLGAGSIVLARFKPRHVPLPWLAAGLTAALLITWKQQVEPVDVTLFPWVALGLGLLYSGGAYAALWGSASASVFATLSAASGLAALLIAYGAMAGPPAGVAWGVVCVLAAAGYALAAAPLVRAGVRARVGDAALAALLVAVTGFVSLAVPIEFERRLIPVAWAIEVPLLALLYMWLRVAVLRELAGLLAVLSVVSLLIPDVLREPIGPTPIWNWLLYAYGVPAAALAAGAWLFHRGRERVLSQILQAGIAVCVFSLVTLEVRHYFHRDAILGPASVLEETASYVSAWLGLALLSVLAARGAARAVAQGAAKAFAGLAVVFLVGGLLLAQNPLWHDASVAGWKVVNTLVPMYGLPTALLLVLAWRMRTWEPEALPIALAIAGVVSFFALVTLEVRHWFLGDVLRGPPPSTAETAAYVCAWLALALAARAAARGVARPVALPAAYAFSAAGMAAAWLGLLLVRNPRWHHEAVGAVPVLNELLWLYGLPAILCFAAARWVQRDAARLAMSLAVTGLVATFALVTLQVRQAFRGEYLTGPAAAGLELYAYSVAWIVFGLVLLGLGVMTRGLVLRWASLAVMLLAVGKVFLVDAAQLRDLYRVLSLFGLGISLMLLAFVYQRFVFGRAERVPAPAGG